MKELFINKYKPIRFNDYDDNCNIIKALKLILQNSNSFNTNILLFGESNSGKSTLLNTIFTEYYIDVSHSCFFNNVLYINNVTDQGINFYRNEVKNFCQIQCNIPKKKKIIIIDDIDLINEQSQQVFRSFIDKYSNNVLFISATSNIQKVIDSLQTRFLILKLHSFNYNNLFNLFNKIKTNENISVDPEAQDFIIKISNNNLKLLTQYLQKCKLVKKNITLELALNICCDISFYYFETYTNYLIQSNLCCAINILQYLYNKGYSIIDILDGYFSFIKNYSKLDNNIKFLIIQYICKYIFIFYNIHEDPIELIFFTNNLVDILSSYNITK